MRNSHAWRASRGFLSASAVAAALWACAGGRPVAQSVPAPVSSPPCDIQTTERIVAVGDAHGAFDKFVTILREAKLIDSRRRWIGGRAIFVQTGDITDRGPDSRKIIDLLRKLTEEAAKAGGQVHALLGNHEAMRVLSFYRDVGPGEYAAFRTPESENLRDRYYELVLAESEKQAKAAGTKFDARAFRTEFLNTTPLGFVEMQMAFAPKADYGRWLRERDTMIKINGIAFMHGGASAAVAPLGCAAINARVRAELGTMTMADPGIETSFLMGTDGPLWYRGLVDGTPGIGPVEVEAILTALGARALVVGHTVPDGFRVRSSYEGRIVQIDTGMLNGEFYSKGVPSALEIHGDTWTVIYVGRREPLQPSVGGGSPAARQPQG